MYSPPLIILSCPVYLPYQLVAGKASVCGFAYHEAAVPQLSSVSVQVKFGGPATVYPSSFGLTVAPKYQYSAAHPAVNLSSFSVFG